MYGDISLHRQNIDIYRERKKGIHVIDGGTLALLAAQLHGISWASEGGLLIHGGVKTCMYGGWYELEASVNMLP